MLQNGRNLEKKLEKETTFKRNPTLYRKGHNRGLNPEHHTHVRQRLKTLRYLMGNPVL